MRSGSIIYDAALLPSDFQARGFEESDFVYWEDRFYESLSRQDQPLCQALVQGEIDRCGAGAAALSARLERLDREESIRSIPALGREIKAVQAHMERVIAVYSRHRRK